MMAVKQVPAIEDAYLRQREWLARAGEMADALGLYVCVENLFRGHDGRIYTPTPSRLAAELAAIGHPRVVATLDFGHAHLQGAYTGADLIAEVAALAPYAKHLHIHDNFGLADDIWTYGIGEKLAFGHGDLHLPVGWGNLPWEALIDACAFPDDVVFNIELEGPLLARRRRHRAGDQGRLRGNGRRPGFAPRRSLHRPLPNSAVFACPIFALCKVASLAHPSGQPVAIGVASWQIEPKRRRTSRLRAAARSRISATPRAMRRPSRR